MPLTVANLARACQTLLTDRAAELAQQRGLGQRRRVATPEQLIHALIFTWWQDPKGTAVSLALQLGMTAAALGERLTTDLAEVLRLLLQEALQLLLSHGGRRLDLPLLQRFGSVSVEDCTSVALAAALAKDWPGCGGSGERTQAGLKLHVRWDLRDGGLRVAAHPQRANDCTLAEQAAGAEPLPAGSLRLADLGFFDLEQLRRLGEGDCWWISRLPCRVKLHAAEEAAAVWLADWLSQQRGPVVDTWLPVGAAEALACRLVALRCPAEVVRRRQQRARRQAGKKGRPLGAHAKVLCGWTVFVTNLPSAQYPAQQIWELYRLRWQIELLFKRWKSRGGLASGRGRTAGRVLCELYAKLLGLVLREWLVLQRVTALDQRSADQALKELQGYGRALHGALGKLARLGELLTEILDLLARLPRRPRRTKHPSARQRMEQPALAS